MTTAEPLGEQLPRWSVTDVHESFEARSFLDAMDRCGADVARLVVDGAVEPEILDQPVAFRPPRGPAAIATQAPNAGDRPAAPRSGQHRSPAHGRPTSAQQPLSDGGMRVFAPNQTSAPVPLVLLLPSGSL